MVIITNSVLEITTTYSKTADQTHYSSEVVAVFDDYKKARKYIEDKITDTKTRVRCGAISDFEIMAFLDDEYVVSRRYEIYTFRLD